MTIPDYVAFGVLAVLLVVNVVLVFADRNSASGQPRSISPNRPADHHQ
jgi:hypothetical protein